MPLISGMRLTIRSPRSTRRRPAKFAANKPVTSRMPTASNRPRPGMLKPSSASGRHGAGNSNSSWSTKRIRKRTTRNVTSRGIHRISPVTRYFRNVLSNAACLADTSPGVFSSGFLHCGRGGIGLAGALAAVFAAIFAAALLTALSGLRAAALLLALGGRLRFCALALRGGAPVALAVRFGDVASLVVLEVGLVPAAALEAKTGRGHLAFQLRRAAGRTVHQRGIRQPLQGV